MQSGFQPQLHILPPPQRRLWDELGAVPAEFVLYGGTALALHLGHRVSEDFDFFGNLGFQPREIIARIPFLAGAPPLQQSPNTLTVVVDRGGPVRVSFFGLPSLARLHPPLVMSDNGLRLASLLDLAATKVAVVQQRAEAKDYLDISALLDDQRVDLPLALAAASAVYGPEFQPQITLKALSYFGDGNLSTLAPRIQQQLSRAARTVNLDRLPEVPPA